MDSDCLANTTKDYGTDMTQGLATAISPSDLDSLTNILGMVDKQKDLRLLPGEVDHLALSWASYHVWLKDPGKRYVDWRDLEASAHDVEMAQVTRRYYRDQLMMRVLKTDRELTPFARDLYDICNGGALRECHRGMLYRLPYFYVEDITLLDIYQQYQQAFPAQDATAPFTSTRTLQPDRVVFRSRRNNECMQYWFRDQESGRPVMWPVKYDNPLRSIVEHLHSLNQPLTINASWFTRYQRIQQHMLQHWQLANPKLVTA